jgi:hypothetical protein
MAQEHNEKVFTVHVSSILYKCVGGVLVHSDLMKAPMAQLLLMISTFTTSQNWGKKRENSTSSCKWGTIYNFAP